MYVSAGQVVNYTLCLPIGVRENDIIDSLEVAIFFFIQDETARRNLSGIFSIKLLKYKIEK